MALLSVPSGLLRAISQAMPSIGTVASGVADDSSEPVKVGGVNRTTPPTFTDGQRGDAQLDTRGALLVALRGANGTTNVTVASAVGDGLTGNGALVSAAVQALYNGASWDRARTPTTFKTVAAVAITAGTGATIWTPGAGKKFRLMGWALSVSAAAALIFGDNAVGTVILRSELLAAAGISQDPPGFGNGFLSAAANNVLKLDVTANATVSGFVFGTEE